MPTMMYVDLNVRFHYRQLAIRALVDAGLKVHTYGEGYNYIECQHPENIIQHGSANSQQCLDKISQAKISLNVMPWFKDGAHDRVFNSCLNGAVSLTDSSRYLDEIFTDDENILFYDLNMLRIMRLPATIQRLQSLWYEGLKSCYRIMTGCSRLQIMRI